MCSPAPIIIVLPSYPVTTDRTTMLPYQIHDCGCPTYAVCMNTACPRAVRVSCHA